ncbi:MAG: cyclodeaminase/cyclohydrolase family protein [Actinomycetota bacterium]|nr:cyclodeaminase/cyclohydrolase family protein [Actinomycetota bacterium]
MYIKGTIESFLEKLASSSPEPGGGAASALVSAVGAALVSMVLNLTIGKEKYAHVEGKARELLERSERLRKELEELVQRDTEVYAVLARAFKMPRETEDEKAKRKEEIQKALREATEVPFAIARECLEVAECSVVACEIGNVNAVSDAGVAAILAEAAACCAALNVKINLVSIGDSSYSEAKWEEIQDIISKVTKVREKVVGKTYELIG